jgi:hypothetical protein
LGQFLIPSHWDINPLLLVIREGGVRRSIFFSHENIM